MTDSNWDIESRFRDGSARVRDEDGKYRSLSQEILEETSEVVPFSESEVAAKLGVEVTVVVEHLHHLRKHGLVEQVHGMWRKPNEFDPASPGYPERTQDEEWEYDDDESLY